MSTTAKRDETTMRFKLDQAIEILSRTPSVIDALLRDLPKDWLESNEGEDTFSPHGVAGHLVHGEEADWIARTKIILERNEWRTFDPFDRFAHIEKYKGMSTEELLDVFRSLREGNLNELRKLGLKESDLSLRATHPDLGGVTLGQLLSTWVVHDLGHIGQIVRVMSKQYSQEVGPWKAYLRVLQS
jgi:hypothetical protein